MDSSFKTIKGSECCFFCNKILQAEDDGKKKLKYEYIKHSNRKISYICPECASEFKKNAKAAMSKLNSEF